MRFRFFAATALIAAAASSFAFTTLGTKWSLGPNQATILAGNEGTAGSFTWSVMGAGLGYVGGDHGGETSISFGSLIGTASDVEEVSMLNTIFNQWADVCGLVNLGQTADGGVASGGTQASGGHLGDIRVSLVDPDGFDGLFGVLAHAFQPGTEAIFLDGTLGGDVHLDGAEDWVDDPLADLSGTETDLYTVLLHEVGHSLGLGHSGVSGSVMEPIYAGARRSLSADDIAGAQFIYGQPEAVPEPATMAGLGLGAAWLLRRRKRSK
jgi:hypothetical protein